MMLKMMMPSMQSMPGGDGDDEKKEESAESREEKKEQVDDGCGDDEEDEDDEEEGTKMSFKIDENLICISLMSKYIYKMKKFVHVKSLMGLKIWRSWGVDTPISNLQQVRVLLKNHAQLQNSNTCGGRCRFR